MDIDFKKELWLDSFEVEYKKANPIFTLFSSKPAPIGVGHVNVPIIGAGEIQDLDRGIAPDLAGMVNGEVQISINKHKAYDETFNDLDAVQYDVDARSAFVETATPAHLGAIDSDLFTILEAYRSLNSLSAADYLVATATPVEDDDEKIAKEVQRLLTKALGKMKKRLGKDGVNRRFLLLDSFCHDNLVMGSPKQSPERLDVPFGYARGTANPILGTQPYDAGVLTRTLVAEDEYFGEHTIIRGFLCMPSAVGVGVQVLPDIEAERSASKRETRLCTTGRYGMKSVLTKQYCELYIKVLGDHT
jgi:hypothetical protein